MTRKHWMSGLLLAAVGTVAGVAWAGLWEFQTAAKLENCGAIPYQYTQNECRTYHDDVKKWCHDYKSYREEVEKLIQNIEDNKRKLEEAKSRNNRSVIPALEKKITDDRDKITEYKKPAAQKLHRATECLAARERVERVFKEAKRSVEAAGKDDPELAPYATIIVAKYDAGFPGHAQAIANVKTARVNLLWLQNVTVP
jgi:cell division septum initiation protein DivIVA